MQELQLEHLRFPEIQELIEQGWDRAVFACGAVEQHGPHLPLFVDAEHGSELARRLASKTGNTLVAPTIRIGCSDHHMSFAGTISLRKSTFEAIVSDYVASLSHHGFKEIWIIPSHGGNFMPLQDMLPRLKEISPTTKIKIFSNLSGLMITWKTLVQERMGLGDRVGGHADIAETAIMKYLHPELVRDDLAQAGFTPELTDEVMQKIISEGFDKVTPNGIMGDARGASAELGDYLMNKLVEVLFRHFSI